jgi:hypothetical protein
MIKRNSHNSIRINGNNVPRTSQSNTPRANNNNAIILDDKTFREIIALSEKYNLEAEIKRLKSEINSLQSRAKSNKNILNTAINQVPPFAVQLLGRDSIEPCYGLGSQAHMAAAATYMIAQQTKFLINTIPGYSPSPIAASALRLFSW